VGETEAIEELTLAKEEGFKISREAHDLIKSKFYIHGTDSFSGFMFNILYENFGKTMNAINHLHSPAYIAEASEQSLDLDLEESKSHHILDEDVAKA
jgi:hypothetical protein